jgi:hypothetical protein
MQRTLASAMVIGLAASGGCESRANDAAERGEDERGAVLRVVEAGRTALLAGDGQTACGLLTTHGRTRALGFQVDFAPTGTPVPTKRRGVPQTCEQILRAESKREHLAEANQSWTPDLKQAKFTVVAINHDTAHVRLEVPGAYGPTVEFSLRKTAHGWRVDDSDAVPSGY